MVRARVSFVIIGLDLLNLLRRISPISMRCGIFRGMLVCLLCMGSRLSSALTKGHRFSASLNSVEFIEKSMYVIDRTTSEEGVDNSLCVT